MSAHDDEDAPQAAPKTAEEAQRFKAMNAIEASNNDAGSGSAEVDSEALGKAMQGLQGGKKKEEDNAWKTVKVEAGDVTVLMEEFLLGKAKATEVLKRSGGDLEKALRNMVDMVY